MTDQEIERVSRLVDTPMPELRIIAFDGGDEKPSQREADIRFSRWTRGELIAHILSIHNGG